MDTDDLELLEFTLLATLLSVFPEPDWLEEPFLSPLHPLKVTRVTRARKIAVSDFFMNESSLYLDYFDKLYHYYI